MPSIGGIDSYVPSKQAEEYVNSRDEDMTFVRINAAEGLYSDDKIALRQIGKVRSTIASLKASGMAFDKIYDRVDTLLGEVASASVQREFNARKYQKKQAEEGVKLSKVNSIINNIVSLW